MRKFFGFVLSHLDAFLIFLFFNACYTFVSLWIGAAIYTSLAAVIWGVILFVAIYFFQSFFISVSGGKLGFPSEASVKVFILLGLFAVVSMAFLLFYLWSVSFFQAIFLRDRPDVSPQIFKLTTWMLVGSSYFMSFWVSFMRYILKK